MSFSLLGFCDYLQNQQPYNVLQPRERPLQHHGVAGSSGSSGPPPSDDATPVSTTLLALLLVLTTVEGVILVLSTLYGWGRHPAGGGEDRHVLWPDDDEDEDLENENDERPADGRGRWGVADGHEGHFRHRRRRRRPHDGGGNRAAAVDRGRRLRPSLLLDQQWDEAAPAEGEPHERCCPICLVDFGPPVVGSRAASGRTRCCRNYFHRDCLEEWLTIRPNCPCCRQSLLAGRPKRPKPALPAAAASSGGTAATATTIPSSSSSNSSSNNFHSPPRTDGDQDDEDQDDLDDAASAASDSITASSDASEWTPEAVPDFAVDSWDHFWFLIF